MVDIYNFSLYKDARLKQWEGYLCKPPVGTCFLGDKRCSGVFRINPYITSTDYNDLCIHNQSLADLLRNTGCVVGPDNYILYDAAGRYIKLCGSQVFGRFRTQTGMLVTEDFVVSNSYKSSNHPGYYIALDQRGKLEDKSQLLQTGVFDWVKVQSLLKEQYKALFVPLSECITLGNGIVVNNSNERGHGKGDFIVVRVTPQGIDWQNMMCFSGFVFQKLFNNIGWTDCLIDTRGYELKKPPSFYTAVPFLSLASGEDRDDLVVRGCSKLEEGISKGIYTCTIRNNICYYRALESLHKWDSDSECEYYDDEYYDDEDYVNEDGIVAYDVEVDTDHLRIEMDSSSHKVKVWLYNYFKKYTRIPYSIKCEEDIIKLFIWLGSIQKRGWLSRMRAAYCDLATRNAISVYTGSAFYNLNLALYNNTIERLGIEAYLTVYNLYSFLERCSMHVVRIFRGSPSVSYYTELEEGSRVELNSFTSWSLKYTVAEQFSQGNDIFIVENVRNIHAAYIDTISTFRGTEQEVLLNAGYILVLDHLRYECKYGYDTRRVWICHLEENEDYYLREKTTPEEDFIKALGNTINGDPRLRGNMYVQEIENKLFICSSFSDKNLQIKIEDGKWMCGDLRGSLNDVNGSVAKIMKYLYGVAAKIREKLGSDKLYYHGSTFMYNITSKFASEGYQIIKQEFTCEGELKNKKIMRGSLLISGDSDDHITLRFGICDDLSVKVSARDKENQIRQTFPGINDEVYQKVYDEVVHKCKLNQFGRLEKALKLLSGYCREPLTVIDKGKYSLGDKYQIRAVMDGEMVNLNMSGGVKSSHSYYFWDNLRDIAIGISNALVGKKE